jgi:hypothetical protein
VVESAFNPLSSSTPARPGPSTLSIRTSTTISRHGREPYRRLLINPPPINPLPSALSPLLPAITVPEPSSNGHNSGESSSSGSRNSNGAEGADIVIVPVPLEVGMPFASESQPANTLDPLRFTGALRTVGLRANSNPTPTTPDRSMGQVAAETPMARSTRYGTEIDPSMQHLL